MHINEDILRTSPLTQCVLYVQHPSKTKFTVYSIVRLQAIYGGNILHEDTLMYTLLLTRLPGCCLLDIGRFIYYSKERRASLPHAQLQSLYCNDCVCSVIFVCACPGALAGASGCCVCVCVCHAWCVVCQSNVCLYAGALSCLACVYTYALCV